MNPLHDISPRFVARIAGGLYLFSIVVGVAALVLTRRNMQPEADKLNLAAGVLYTGLTVLLWYLFLHVHRWISSAAAIASLAGCWLPQSFFAMVHFGNFVFFGLYCLLVSWLIAICGFIPRIIGGFMATAGACWLVVAWPRLAHALSPFPILVGLVGEGTVMVYLLTRGLDERRWREQASDSLRIVTG